MSNPNDLYVKGCKDLGIMPLKSIEEVLKSPPKVLSFK